MPMRSTILSVSTRKFGFSWCAGASHPTRLHLNMLSGDLPLAFRTGIAKARSISALRHHLGAHEISTWLDWSALAPTTSEIYRDAHRELSCAGYLDRAYTFSAPLKPEAPDLGFHVPLSEYDVDCAGLRIANAIRCLAGFPHPRVLLLTDPRCRYAGSDLADLLIQAGAKVCVDLIMGSIEASGSWNSRDLDLIFWVSTTAPPSSLMTRASDRLVTINGSSWNLKTRGDVLHHDAAPYFAFRQALGPYTVSNDDILLESSSAGELLLSAPGQELVPLLRLATGIDAKALGYLGRE